jgi:hypothetical protein
VREGLLLWVFSDQGQERCVAKAIKHVDASGLFEETRGAIPDFPQESRVRENLMHGLTRGCRKRSHGEP